MCGIVGYVGDRDCVPILMEGLHRLEYRGYDSAGIAVLVNSQTLTPRIEIRRISGKVAALGTLLRERPLSGAVGIGHTRWATHGKPSEENAHPHRAGKVALVHNGIIENYLELRSFLQKAGRQFSSETDTEVLSHLIDMYLEDAADLESAVRKALLMVRGSYAIAVLCELFPQCIVVARSASPLIIGLGRGENFVASDIPALLGFTQNIVVLDDGEMATITAQDFRVKAIATGETVRKTPMVVNLTPAMAEKGGFKHFMLKEIHEQPRAIIDTMRGRISVEAAQIHLEPEGPDPCFLAQVPRVHLAACGTSWHAALVGRLLITSLARVPVEVHLAGEFDPNHALPGPHEFFVAISQSGETLDTLRTHRDAKQCGLKTMAITNTVASSLAREADFVFYTHAGPEISVASTKAFTTQIVALYLLGLAIASARRVLGPAEIQQHLRDLLTLPGLVEVVLRGSPAVKNVAEHYVHAQHMLFLGRGLLYPVALEGALKLKEISYVHAEGYSAGEMKHGPIALIDENFPCLVLCPRGPSYQKTLLNLEEVRARRGRLIALATLGDHDVFDRAHDILTIPHCPAFLLPVVASVPLQLLAYHVADLKGTDVDQPRNLAKSVTVE